MDTAKIFHETKNERHHNSATAIPATVPAFSHQKHTDEQKGPPHFPLFETNWICVDEMNDAE